MRLTPFVAIAVCLTSAACGILTGNQGHGPFRITTDKPSYSYGTRVAVGVRNISDKVQSYNFCPVTLQTFQDGSWISVSGSPPPGVACAAMAHTLQPGDSAGFIFTLPSDQLLGEYRLVLPWLGDTNLSVDQRATPPFTISCYNCALAATKLD
ncbi:MAG TPA: hypothetical protein VGJ18_24575 [Gemmatimonadaceae bacterium]|jgi:hypothetical protein